MVRCPQCKRLILPENNTPQTGFAQCPDCNLSVQYTYQAEVRIDRDTVQNPPPGIVVIDRIYRTVIRCRQRANSLFDTVAPGLIGCAVSGSLFYMLCEKEFPLRLLAMTVMGLTGLISILSLLYGLFGKMEIRDDGEILTLMSGVGPFGRTRQLRPSDIQKVELIQKVTESGKTEANEIELETTYHIVISCRENQIVKCFYNSNADAVRYFCSYLQQKAKLNLKSPAADA